MHYERDNTSHGGEGSNPDFNRTDNRDATEEPVVVAEQPACPVDSQPEGARGWSQPQNQSQGQFQNQPSQDGPWSQAGTSPSGTNTWNQPGAGVQYDAWNRAGDGDSLQPGVGGQNMAEQNTTGQNISGQNTAVPDQGQPVYKTAPPSYSGQQQYQYQNQNQYQTQRQKPAEEKNGMAITSLVMGILSLISCCCSWIAIVFGILGIIFAIMSKGERSLSGQAKTGLILSVVGVALNVILIILAIALQVFTLIPEVF